MSSPEKIADKKARDLIKSEIYENIFVEAGAGSGKTTELVNRMVNMVKNGIAIDKICAITFTKAAANEFYARFKALLEEKSLKGDEKCRDALTNIDLCFMGTIDSFCHMILSEHPREAGIPADSQLLDDDMKAAYYRKVYSDVQKGKYGNTLKDMCRQFRAFNGYNSESIFISLVGDLMEKRNTEFDIPAAAPASVDEMFADEKDMLESVYTALNKNKDIGYTGSQAAITAWEEFLGNKDIIFGEWDDNILRLSKLIKKLKDLKLTGEADLSILGRASDAYEFKDSKQKRYQCYILKDEYSSSLDEKLNELKYVTAMRLAIETVRVIAEELKKEGKISYFDYQYYLLQMLKKDAANGGKLIKHIYDRHSYFLLDEFQDTDPMQAQIFFYLAAEKLDDEWDKCIPHKGSLFIVGDPKQSIYRFRNADVGAFKKVKGLFKDKVGKVVTLPCNFRSTKTMCEWFNDTFTEMMPEDTAEQSKFDNIPLDDKKDIPETFGGVYKYSPYFTDGDETIMDDPARVAEIIEQLVGNPEYLIQEEKEKDNAPRMIRYNDIMVITSGKGKIGQYISLFAEERIPYNVEGSAEFRNSRSLVEIENLYSAIAEPNDRNRLYAALKGKVFGISNSRLINAVNEGQPINAFIADTQVKDHIVGDALHSIRDMYVGSVNLSPATLFSMIMDEYRIFERTGAENAEYTYYALELLRAGESSGSISTIKEGAEFLRNLVDGGSGLERIMSLVQDENRVHIANLHKVKGLEAPIVILTSSEKYIRIRQRVDITQTPPRGWILAVTEGFNTLLSAPGYDDEKEAEKESQAAEHLRLLYVAATRARRALIMGCKLNKAGAPAPSNYWAELIDNCDNDFEELPVGTPAVKSIPDKIDASQLYSEAADNVLKESKSDNKTYEVRLPSKIKIKSISSSEDIYEDETDEEVKADKKKKDAALTGTLVHRLMELIVSSNNMLDTDSMVKDILSEYGADAADYGKMLHSVAAVIRGGGYIQQNGKAEDILNELLYAEEKYCEMPFCYENSEYSEIWNGVMDVVYRMDDKWHIVDYKTDTEIKNIEEKHEEQLNAYIKAFKILTGEDADARIYHIGV